MAFANQAGPREFINGRFQSQSTARVTEAWRFSGVLRVHSEIDDVRHNLNVPLGLHVSTHHIDREEPLAYRVSSTERDGVFDWARGA